MTSQSAPSVSQRGSGNLVQLNRFVSLHDRAQTCVFSFLLPSHLTKGFLSEALSKEFQYANQLWNIRVDTNGTHLGAYLELPGLLTGCQVKVDYQFTMINRDHFTRNESFGEKDAMFHCDCSRRGRTTFMELSDLRARHFLYDDWRCVLELEMRGCTTTYMEDILLPRDAKELQQLQQLETSCFTYGGTDWSVVIDFPQNMTNSHNISSSADTCQLSLRRHGKSFQECRFSYRALISWSSQLEQRQDTGYMNAHADVNGDTRPSVRLNDAFQQNAIQPRGRITIRVELGPLTWMSRLEIFPLNRGRNCVRCVDTEQRAWLLQSDVLGRFVTLRFFYQDANNLPPHYSRMVAWNVIILPWDRKKSLIQSNFPPYAGYFTAGEEGNYHEVTMNLPVEEVCDNQTGFVHPESGALTIQVDWLHSYLLYLDKYGTFDDNVRLHRHQMTREITTLQCENLALEKQVHSYQMSIAKKNTGLEDVNSPSRASSIDRQGTPTNFLMDNMRAEDNQSPSISSRNSFTTANRLLPQLPATSTPNGGRRSVNSPNVSHSPSFEQQQVHGRGLSGSTHLQQGNSVRISSGDSAEGPRRQYNRP